MEIKEGTRKPNGGSEFAAEQIPTRITLSGYELSGSEPHSQQPRMERTILRNAESKQTNIMRRVYEMQRLHTAWHQVKQNAGAAGIDEMTVEDFDSRKEELIPLIHERLKGGEYRFKPALSKRGLVFLDDYTQRNLELPFCR